VAVGAAASDAVEESLVGARRHAGALLPMAHRALARRGIGLDGVEGLALSDGPGSFTGLRVGAAVAKALVRARGLPLWVAPSLMVRAAGVASDDGALVLAVTDALRGEVYAGAFRFEPGRVGVELAPAVRRPEDLAGLLPAPARSLLDLVGRTGGARRLTEVSSWEPDYGRPAEAQARWETAHGRPLPDPAGGAR
jgi:tRNA threonylcarbamoyl adenosine modification protein YeaZ